jgi:hypothetical protein
MKNKDLLDYLAEQIARPSARNRFLDNITKHYIQDDKEAISYFKERLRYYIELQRERLKDTVVEWINN